MNIYILMAQRKCAYPGQYAPEALACMSGPEYSDNPGYLHDARQSNIDTGDFDAVEIVALTVDRNEIDRRLFPATEPVSASCA
jgi:hypothetical protein